MALLLLFCRERLDIYGMLMFNRTVACVRMEARSKGSGSEGGSKCRFS